jgi:DNA-binding NarL/FixJ family response regulator
MTRPRVLLADDHQIVAEGLRSLLEPEFELVGIVADGRAALAAVEKLRPDVLVLDLTMPLLNGIEAAQQLRAAGSPVKVVFLTMHNDAAYAARALDAGATGFVLKHAAAAELVTAIRQALQGRTYVTPLIAADLLQAYRRREHGHASTFDQLTPRQREVLQLVAEGHTAKEIARLLHISPRTAEFHKARLMQALGASSISELIQHAIRNGLPSKPFSPATGRPWQSSR